VGPYAGPPRLFVGLPRIGHYEPENTQSRTESCVFAYYSFQRQIPISSICRIVCCASIFAFLYRCCPCIFVALTHCIVLHSCCCVPYYLCVTCLLSSLAAPAEHLWAFVSILVPELHLEAISAALTKSQFSSSVYVCHFVHRNSALIFYFLTLKAPPLPPPTRDFRWARELALFLNASFH
jgi:hypothetical protein